MEVRPEHPTRAPWAVWHPIVIFLGASFLAAIVVAIVGVTTNYIDVNDLDNEDQLPRLILVTGVAQYAFIFLGLKWLSRSRGTGDMRADFHLQVRASDWVAFFWGVGLLFAASIALGLILDVFGLEADTQEVVEAARQADDLAERLGFALIIAVVAPILEEMLFRGALLDALKARTSTTRAVWWTGVIFGLVHALDPAAFLLVPALVALGVILGFVRERSGSLSKPILMHMGFNAVTATALFVAAGG